MFNVNRTTYYGKVKEWCTSPNMPLSKETVNVRPSENRTEPFSLHRAIKVVALGILAASHSFRISMSSSTSGAQLALPPFAFHLWSQIPTTYAQTTEPIVQSPQGDEFQVNTFTAGNQRDPTVTGLTGGGFVVTWAGSGQKRFGIYGQQFDGAGSKVGSEFPISTYSSYEKNPRVMGLTGGGFVVIWESYRPDVSAGHKIYGQLFDGAGAKIGSEFPIDLYRKSLHSQGFPNVAGLTGGGFVVTWDRFPQVRVKNQIYGQLFDGAGAKVGSEFPINNHTSGEQTPLSVAALAGGGCVVTWQSRGQEGSGYDVYGQLFDGAGPKVGSEFQVNTYTADNQNKPSVAALVVGGFVVTWESEDQDGSGYGVYGQRFDGAGAKVGSEFPINTYKTNWQHNPSVAALVGGGFVVIWQSFGQDGSDYGVYGRFFPGNSTSTLKPTTIGKSSAGLTKNPSQSKHFVSSPTLKITPKDFESSQAQQASGVTEVMSYHTIPSAQDLSMQASLTGLDRENPSDKAPSQTPLIAGLASAVAALTCSLFVGGLFFWQTRRGEDELTEDVRLEAGNFDANAAVDRSGSTPSYSALPVNPSHYRNPPQQPPVHDERHYHQNIEELNQQMALAYGMVPSDPQKGYDDINVTS